MAKLVVKNDKKTKRKAAKKEESVSSSISESLEGSTEQIELAEKELEEVEISNEVQSDEEESASDDEKEVSEEESASDDEKESTASGSQPEENDDETLRTIFIKDLDYDVREDDIKKQMVRLGNVIRVTVPMSHDQRRNKGFAYVEFKTVDEAKKALKLDGTELLGRKVVVCQAKPKENKQIITVFCKNLNYNTTKEELKEHFEQFGKVFNVSLPVDSENSERNKGFCFIEYSDREVVDKVLKTKHTVNERLLYLNEGNKNEERSEKRSGDRLYGRRDDKPDRREGGNRRDNDRFDNRRSNDRFPAKRNNDRSHDNNNNKRQYNRFNDRSDDRNEGKRDFNKGKNFSRNPRGNSSNKNTFNDSD